MHETCRLSELHTGRVVWDLKLLIHEAGAQGDLQRDWQALSSILGGLSCDLHSTCHHFWAVAALHSWGGDIPGRVPSERGSLHPFKDSGRFKAQGDHQGRDCDPTTSFLMTSRKGTPPISPTVLSMRRLLLGVLTWTDVK